MPEHPSFLSDVDDVVTAAQLQATVDAMAQWQLESGMVPWFPGGHADPWNHTEALMALMLGGRREEAELGFEWLQNTQHDDGSWHLSLIHISEPTRLKTRSRMPSSA